MSQEDLDELIKSWDEGNPRRKAKKDPKRGPLAPGDLSPSDQGIRRESPAMAVPAQGEAIPVEPVELHPFIIPAQITKKYVYEQQARYIMAGWPVYPADPETGRYLPGYKPKDNPEGIRTVAQFKRLLDRNTRFYRTIIPEGYMVVDLDEKHGHHGIAAFEGLLREVGCSMQELSDLRNGSYPATVRTGSGGLHLYFRLPIGMEFTTWTGARGGVDLLGPGHALVTAGSRKLNMVLYTPNFTGFDGIKVLPQELSRFIFSARAQQRLFAAVSAQTQACRGDDITPEMIFDWNYAKWNDGRREFGGHNEFFMRGLVECKHKGWGAEDAIAAAKESTAFANWKDRDKEHQLEATTRSIYAGEYRQLGWR